LSRYRVEDRHDERLRQMIQDLMDMTVDWLEHPPRRGKRYKAITAVAAAENAAKSLRLLYEAEILRSKRDFGEAVERTLDASALGPLGAYLWNGSKQARDGRTRTAQKFDLWEIAAHFEQVLEREGKVWLAIEATMADLGCSKSTLNRARALAKALDPHLEEIRRLRARD
jgi:hypothetical protein